MSARPTLAVALVLVALALSVMAAGWFSRSPLRTIKIVSSLPLGGVGLRQMQCVVNAIQMAMDESDHRAGPFNVVYESWNDADPDTGTWDAKREQDNAERAAADPDVFVYLGPYNSGAAKVCIPILNRAGMVIVSPANTYPGLTKAGPHVDPREPGIYYPTGIRNYCRLVPTDVTQGAAAAQWALSLGMHRVFVLDDRDVFGKSVAEIFSDECRKRGLDVVGPVGLDPPVANVSDCIKRIRVLGPDLIFFGGTTETGAGRVVHSLRDYGIEAAFMGTGGIKETAFIEAAGMASLHTYCTLGVLPVEKLPAAAKEWYDRYLARYGDAPEAYGLYGYEAAQVALNGIARAGRKDRAAIRDAIMQTRNYHGVLGTWSLDADGDTSIDTVSGYQVRDYRFEFVGVMRPY